MKVLYVSTQASEVSASLAVPRYSINMVSPIAWTIPTYINFQSRCLSCSTSQCGDNIRKPTQEPTLHGPFFLLLTNALMQGLGIYGMASNSPVIFGWRFESTTSGCIATCLAIDYVPRLRHRTFSNLASRHICINPPIQSSIANRNALVDHPGLC